MNTYTITSRPTLLQDGDTVVFVVEGKTRSYAVKEKFLDIMREYHNGQIFMDLGLNPFEFAKAAYGYDPQGGIWPQSNRGDYPALTRLVNALYHIIAEREPEQINPKAEPQPPLTPEQHLDAYLSRFASDRYRSAVKALLNMLETLA